MRASIRVVTALTPSYDAIAALTVPTLQRFADAHGYALQVVERERCVRRGGWVKIEPILEALSQGTDYVLWLDADTLVARTDIDIRNVVNPDVHLHLSWHALALEGTIPHFNTGVMLIRASEWSRSFFSAVWERGPLDHVWNDQATIHHLLGYDELLMRGPDNLDRIGRQPVSSLNLTWNSIPNFCALADPVIWHFAGRPVEQRVRDAQRVLGANRGDATELASFVVPPKAPRGMTATAETPQDIDVENTLTENVKVTPRVNTIQIGHDVRSSSVFGEDYLAEFERVVRRHVKPVTRAYLEWGMGHTTLALLEMRDSLAVDHFCSIDDNQAYLDDIVRQFPAWSGFHPFCCALTGPTVDDRDQELNYSSLPLAWDRRFDFIFIDGRRRMECALTASLVCHRDSIIVLHDYRRARYQHVTALFDIVEDGPQFRVMRPRGHLSKLARAAKVRAAMWKGT